MYLISLNEWSGPNMMNMNKKKTQRIISGVIVVVLILAMVIPTVVGTIY